MKINQITETTTAGAIATVNSPLGGTQSRGNPSIYGGKKVGTLFKGKKTSAPYANSINESADLSEAELQEDDIIMVPGQGKKIKPGFIAKSADRTDHEVEMARSDLFSAAQNAQKVFAMIKDVSEDEGLEGWVQEKIIKANDYLNTIREYLEGKELQRESKFGSGVIGNGAMGESSQQVDSLVTDALKLMRGSEVSDAVRALTTVLGTREYNSRRGFYNFYIKQMIDMYNKQGVAEGQDILKAGSSVMVPNKGKMVPGKVVRYDSGKGEYSPAYIVDIGEYESKVVPAHSIKQGVAEGAKVDRMVKHIASSERKLGKSKDEAENIAWATANKRGMLDNKNKKK